MEEKALNKLYVVCNTIADMLIDRGYTIEQPEIFKSKNKGGENYGRGYLVSKDDFKSYVQSLQEAEKRGVVFKQLLSFCARTEKRLVTRHSQEIGQHNIYLHFGRIDEVKIIKEQIMEKNENNPAILILVVNESKFDGTNGRVRSRHLHPLEQRINVTNQDNVYVELFDEDDFIVNPMLHNDVAPHIPLNTEERAVFLKQYGNPLPVDKLPRLLLHDPVCRYLGLPLGTIVRIRRENISFQMQKNDANITTIHDMYRIVLIIMFRAGVYGRCIVLAKITRGPTWLRDVAVGTDHRTNEGRRLQDIASHKRDGFLFARNSANKYQNLIPHESGYEKKKLTKLPGVPFASDLPADPIARIFFQVKGDYALFNKIGKNDAKVDLDRVALLSRDKLKLGGIHYSVIFDFCHRIREAQEQRKRFVLVPTTHLTKGCAKILFDHGLVAGFRDFANENAFAIELKYFQNEPVIQVIEPASRDRRIEFLWSPKMVRMLKSTYGGASNNIRVFILRTHDGRVIDHLQAITEHIGGHGLMMAY